MFLCAFAVACAIANLALPKWLHEGEELLATCDQRKRCG